MGKTINPDMIVLARESRGLTQSGLAKLLSVTQGKISKIENGMLGVSEDMLKKLSQTLNYPEDFFSFQDATYGTGYSLIYHRKRQSITNKIVGKIHAQINIRRMHLSRLLRTVEISECKIPSLDIDEYNGDAEKIASVIRSNWLLPRGCVKNLTKAIENAGGIVIPCDFETGSLDAVSQNIQGLPPMFFVNMRIPGDRLRFTLAHELGHIIMHRIPNSNMEKEANKFAAELLLPREEIGPFLHSLSLPKLANLKLAWKVSMAALLQRASDLGKISQKKARSLWSQMSMLGYRKREPMELDIPVEEPTLLQELIDTHLNELKCSESKLRQMLAIHEHEFKSIYLKHKPHLTIVN